MKLLKLMMFMSLCSGVALSSQALLDELDMQSSLDQDSSDLDHSMDELQDAHAVAAQDMMPEHEQNVIEVQEADIDGLSSDQEAEEAPHVELDFPVVVPSIMQTSAGFDVNGLSLQAKELEDKKNKINVIVESCFDLIDLFETQQRTFVANSFGYLSKQEQEDKVQNFLIDELQSMTQKVLDINRDLAIRVINSNPEPVRNVDFVK